MPKGLLIANNAESLHHAISALFYFFPQVVLFKTFEVKRMERKTVSCENRNQSQNDHECRISGPSRCRREILRRVIAAEWQLIHSNAKTVVEMSTDTIYEEPFLIEILLVVASYTKEVRP